ncbi:elongation factor 2 [Trichonephila clavipes]|uniref:Elongation factor 2 n=1 Tax=Trichonephila clavipes TaxID=2585209 RepID=A0A8X6T4T1_TRICX|nr:elongation factor 2 [Trichonephila clavipes]
MAASGANESDSENETNDSSMQADSMGKNLDLEINKMHVDNGSQNKIIYVNSNVNVNYSDIENTISKFNAEPHENINNWIKHFENIAELFCLSNLQKFVFAKRSLGGIAKLFIQTELQINSWEKLKQALIDEFSLEINSSLLHELLRNRKIRDCETTLEYFLKMKELCNSGKIDDSALMHYVIKGINDRQENKIILYGCNILTLFKEKLKIYEAIKNDYVKCRGNFDKIKPIYDFNRYNSCDKMKTKYDEKCNFRKVVVNKNKMRYDNYNTGYESYKKKLCFNCGNPNHISRNCMYKNERIKCFRCEVFGHKASECPDNNDTKLDIAHLIINKEETLTKKVLIDGLILDALIDSGSRVTLMRKSVYDKINHVQLFPLNTTLRGFSNSKVRVFGYFKDDIQIDDLKCNVEICVVNDDAMLYDVIIGLNVLMQVANLSVLPINLSPDDIEISIAPDIPQINESKNKTITPNCVPVKKDGLHVKDDQRTVTVSPVEKVSVELQHPSDLPKLEDDLKRFEKPDPMIQCITGKPDIVDDTEELHLENCLKDVKEDKASIHLKKTDPVVVVPEMSSGGLADSKMAVWCRPLFPSHSNYSTPHAHERTEGFGSLPVVRRSTGREPTQLERVATQLKEDVCKDEMTD